MRQIKAEMSVREKAAASQIKDRNSFNLSAELSDNQGAMEAAQAQRDSSLSLKRHNRGSVWEAGPFEWCYAAVSHLVCYDFVLSVN